MIRILRLKVSEKVLSCSFWAILFLVFFILISCSKGSSKPLSLNDWNAIFSIICKSLGAIIGILGLILGYCFFKSRLNHESDTALKDRKRHRIQIVVDQLHSYNLLVNKILSFDIHNDDELTLVRDQIDQSFEQVELWLEYNDKLIGLGDNEMKDILAVNSWIDKNSLIMREKFENLDRSNLQSIRPLYVPLIQRARGVCLNSME